GLLGIIASSGLRARQAYPRREASGKAATVGTIVHLFDCCYRRPSSETSHLMASGCNTLIACPRSNRSPCQLGVAVRACRRRPSLHVRRETSVAGPPHPRGRRGTTGRSPPLGVGKRSSPPGRRPTW